MKEQFPNAEIFGLDLCKAATKIAKERGAQPVIGNFHLIPFKPEVADSVISLYSLGRPDLYVASMCYVLKKGGRLVVSYPNDILHGSMDNLLQKYGFILNRKLIKDDQIYLQATKVKSNAEIERNVHLLAKVSPLKI